MAAAALTYEPGFRARRAMNWLPLGFTYAFLYMGRYNLTVAKSALGDLLTLEQFGDIFGIGTITYAFSFLINGPLTDRFGGRRAILIAAFGSTLANLGMGYYTYVFMTDGSGVDPRTVFSPLYAINMYFQSFGAVAIVKVNSNWFHVTERGKFSGIMGTIIASGIYFAFDWGYSIVNYVEGAGPGGIDANWWIFFVPAIILSVFFVIDVFLIRDNPSDAGFKDFDTGAAKLSANEDQPIPTLELLRRILTHPIIMTVACIELCTGVVRQGIMQWYKTYAEAELVLNSDHLMLAQWGLILFIAGVLGSNFAGWVSDRFFQSRRAPAAGGLFAVMTVAILFMCFSLGGTKPTVAWAKSAPKAAVAAGLRTGDLIFRVDGEPVTDRARLITALEAPGEHKLGVFRRDADLQLTFNSTPELKKELPLRKFMVYVPKPVMTGEASRLASGTSAVFWRGAWADEMGLKKGDEIVSIGGQKPSDWGDLLAAIDQSGPQGSDTPVTLLRDGKTVEMTLWYPPQAPRAQGAKREEMAKFVAAGPTQTLDPMVLGGLIFFISLCVIGVHGLLSGTATMDFGGKRGTATAVGVIDGFVYLGTAIQSFSLGRLNATDWTYWPVFMLPFAIIATILLRRIWHAKPSSGGGH